MLTRRCRPLLAGVSALLPAALCAQQPGGVAISGRVLTDGGAALPGATVFIQGTQLGVTSQADGRYTFTVPAAQATGQRAVLAARRIGYRGETVPVTLTAGARITQDFTLVSTPTQLEGMVVTALGIERDKRSLGVAQQSVAPEELSTAKDPNVVNALSGKVAGVEVTNAGPPGGSARIVIRGQNSITGNNQPLFVVDGIPIDNSAPRNTGFGGLDYGNAASDINPDDVESVSVLKGANAAALYGSRAANGAIVITTKNGRGSRGLGVTLTQNLTFENPLRLPEFQDVYGQGSGGLFSYKDGKGGGIADNVNRSWGPRMDGRLITQWWSDGQPAPWVPAPNNVRDFFQTGRTSTTSAEVTGASDRADVRLAVTNLDMRSMFPTNTIRRLNTSLNGGATITPKLSTRATVSYVQDRGHNRTGTGYDGNSAIYNLMIWGGRQRDLPHMKNYMAPDGRQIGPNSTTTNNPYWDVYADPNDDTRDRVIGSGQVQYKVNPWLTAVARTGTDWYRSWRSQRFADGNIAVDYSGGAFFEQNAYLRETNSDLLLTADNGAKHRLGLRASVGGNLRSNLTKSANLGTPHLVVPGTFNIANSAVTPQVSNNTSARRVNSALAQAQLSWKDYAFLDLTGRNDWSSTLPAGSNGYFYPSASGSFVFTDALPATRLHGLLSYGKLRASWAQVGSDADPYQLQVAYSAGTPFGSVPRFGVPNNVANANLKPEHTRSFEGGAELRFVDDRVSLDATYYSKATTDQIIPAQISPTIGYTSATVNAGTITNKGFELQAGLTPLRNAHGLSWDVTVNFAENRSRVTSLYPGLQTVVLGTYWGMSVEARLGELYGTFYGNPYLRDPQGRLVLANGLPQIDQQKIVMGHYSPNWVGGVQNHLRYKGVDFSFLVDTKQGGRIFSTTKMFGNMSGVLKSSLWGRENGETLTDGGAILIEGVNADGTPNTTKTTSQAYFNALFQLHEPNMVTGSFVKLREARLGYDVPARYARRLRVSALNVGVVGRNLHLWTNAPDIDPETAFDASNAQGIEFANFPTARSVGLAFKVTP
jgi:TonB-linked SusC/RagA family outer membrane protein